jgi:hypothetical protein
MRHFLALPLPVGLLATGVKPSPPRRLLVAPNRLPVGSDDAPSHGTPPSSSAAPGRTTSRCTPPAGTDRTRSGGSRDAAPRSWPPKGGPRPPHRGILDLSGAHPGLPAVGGFPSKESPPPVLHFPRRTTPQVALPRDDDAEQTGSRKRGQGVATMPRFSTAVDSLGLERWPPCVVGVAALDRTGGRHRSESVERSEAEALRAASLAPFIDASMGGVQRGERRRSGSFASPRLATRRPPSCLPIQSLSHASRCRPLRLEPADRGRSASASSGARGG